MVGDYVKILNQQECQPRLASFIASNRFELLDNFTLGKYPDMNSTFVIECKEHDVCIIRDLQNNKVYVINECGLGDEVQAKRENELRMLRSLKYEIEQVLDKIKCDKYEYLQENLGYTLNVLEDVINN